MAQLLELQAKDRDARFTYLVNMDAGVGGMYFSGADGMRYVLDISHSVSYLPAELAKLCARCCAGGPSRARAIVALAFAATARILPSSGVDPEIQAILNDAMNDADPEVQQAAQNAVAMLRDELARAQATPTS